jgi:hypothetical protein
MKIWAAAATERAALLANFRNRADKLLARIVVDDKVPGASDHPRGPSRLVGSRRRRRAKPRHAAPSVSFGASLARTLPGVKLTTRAG